MFKLMDKKIIAILVCFFFLHQNNFAYLKLGSRPVHDKMILFAYICVNFSLNPLNPKKKMHLKMSPAGVVCCK